MKKFNKKKLTLLERLMIDIQNFFGVKTMCTIKYYLGYILGYKNKKKELQKLKSFTSISSEFPELLHKAKLLIANSNNELIYETINSFFDSNIKILKNFSNIEEHQVIVVCALKNEITRIKWFLDHYRNLGIKLFLICDNNSTDGTLDFLMQQNDVVLYQTTDKYNSQKKCAWCNRMISDVGDNQWYLVVDADEFIWYPELKKMDLNEYTEKLFKKNIFSVKGLMLEMYPDNNLGDSNLDKSKFLEEYVFYDTDSDYYIYDKDRQLITGGFINRVFKDENALQCKVPLFYQTDIRFNIGSHHIFPYEEDLTAQYGIILKHYKFLPGDEGKIRQAVAQKNYANESKLYKKFVVMYDDGINAFCPLSRKWDSDTVLENLNFIKELTK